ncbi:MAG TPA: TetR/AcrR family transcriptional regulator [Solirubrobacteraceae bacterium]
MSAITPTRERILYAAAELFRRQGYAGTGLNQIVAEAQAPFGSLYHHFPGGKQQLAEDVIRAGGAFFQHLVTAIYDAEPNAEASIRAVFTTAAETLTATDFQDACPIATIALDVASTNDHLRRATAEVFEEWTTALTERLDDSDHALAILAALEGAFVICRAQRTTRPMHAAGEMAAALVTR